MRRDRQGMTGRRKIEDKGEGKKKEGEPGTRSELGDVGEELWHVIVLHLFGRIVLCITMFIIVGDVLLVHTS